jgi:hypothetical protein
MLGKRKPPSASTDVPVTTRVTGWTTIVLDASAAGTKACKRHLCVCGGMTQAVVL